VKEVRRIAGVLEGRGLGRWIPDDVVAEAQLRLAECRNAMYATVKRRRELWRISVNSA
jgi:hypothetical protein